MTTSIFSMIASLLLASLFNWMLLRHDQHETPNCPAKNDTREATQLEAQALHEGELHPGAAIHIRHRTGGHLDLLPTVDPAPGTSILLGCFLDEDLVIGDLVPLRILDLNSWVRLYRQAVIPPVMGQCYDRPQPAPPSRSAPLGQPLPDRARATREEVPRHAVLPRPLGGHAGPNAQCVRR